MKLKLKGEIKVLITMTDTVKTSNIVKFIDEAKAKIEKIKNEKVKNNTKKSKDKRGCYVVFTLLVFFIPAPFVQEKYEQFRNIYRQENLKALRPT